MLMIHLLQIIMLLWVSKVYFHQEIGYFKFIARMSIKCKNK